MPEWAQAGAVPQALSTPRNWIGGFGRVLWRRKLPVLACVGLALASTAAYVSSLTPAYEAEALVASDELPDQETGSSRTAQDPRRVIGTRVMAERLVDRLNLQLLPEFHPDHPFRELRRTALDAIGPLLPTALVHWLATVSVDRHATRPAERAPTDEQRAARLRDAVIETTMTRMRAEVAVPSSIGLKFIAEDPQVAAAGANAMADLYLEQRPPRPPAASRGEREKVDEEIERLRADVRATEQAIAAARGGADAQASGTSQQRRLELTGELAFWRRERAGVEARLRQAQAALEAGADVARTAPDLGSERLGQLQRGAIELQQALAALPQRDGEPDSQIVDLRAQLAALEEERRVELAQILKELRDERGIIQSRETELEAKIKAGGDASTAGAAAGRLTALEQKLAADRALLRARLEQATPEAQPSAPRGDARIIRPAVAPSQPAYPRLALIWSVAAVGALALGVAVAFLLEAIHGARA